MSEKAYARHYTLLRIARERQWGFVQTNEYGESGKSHLLHMRREKLVEYVGWDHPQVIRSGIRASYSDKLALYYCITFKGFIELLKFFPTHSSLDEMKVSLFQRIFNDLNEKTHDFLKFRI